MKKTLSNIMSSSQNLISSMESMNDFRDSQMQFEMVASQRRKLALINYAGMGYVISYTVAILFTTNYLTLPFVFVTRLEDSDSLFFYKALSWFIFVNFFANYALILRGGVKSIYCSPGDLPLYNARMIENWDKCRRCDRQVPVRTRHCNICDRCILKRDHHCYLTGCCIGFYNQRFFICLCFYAIVGALYGFYFLETYLSSSYVTLFSAEFYKFFLPYTVILWLFGYQDIGTVFLVLMLYLSIVACIGSGYFLVWQCNLVIGGQTSYEFLKGQKTHQTNISDHLKSIFGPYWFLNFIFPMPFLKSEGDGLTWKVASTKFL